MRWDWVHCERAEHHWINCAAGASPTSACWMGLSEATGLDRRRGPEEEEEEAEEELT